MKVFVGNLSFDTTEADLKKLFEGFGDVVSVVIVMDEKGKKSRGFGFLEMANGQQAQNAIEALDGKEFMGRPLRVNPVRPKSPDVQIEGDQKEIKKRIKAEKRSLSSSQNEFLGGRRTLRTVRLSAAKRSEQPKHWEKKELGVKPWQKRETGAKPWEKREAGVKPWQKRETGAKPWEKREAGVKPWQKREAGAKPWEKREAGVKPWQKREVGAKPWEKREAGVKPWQKREVGAKPWQKRSKISQQLRNK